MQTLKGTLTLDFKAVITQQLLDDIRKLANAKPAGTFLARLTAQHPVNDDAFIGAILKNSIRHSVREELLGLFHAAGIGGTVSPVTIDIIELPEDFGGAVEPITVIVDRRTLQEVPQPAPSELLPVGLIGDEA